MKQFDDWHQPIHQLCDTIVGMEPTERDIYLRQLQRNHPVRFQQVMFLLDTIDDDSEEEPAIVNNDLIGRTLGPYHIHRFLGRGGMGCVYLARHRATHLWVALKLIRSLPSENTVKRFQIEGRALARLDHPNIGRLLDMGSSDGRAYLVLEYLDGKAITTCCEERELAVREKLALMIAVCRAVGHAHTRGILHRDLKPDNILVVEQDGCLVPKIIDFGLAKFLEEEVQGKAITGQGALLGTLDYMSPEQMTGLYPVSTASDIYALGVLLYRLVTGRLPFHGHGGGRGPLGRHIRTVCESKPVAPGILDRFSGSPERAIPWQRLDEIIMKAMAKDPAQRHRHAGRLAEELEEVLFADRPGRRNGNHLAGGPLPPRFFNTNNLTKIWQAKAV